MKVQLLCEVDGKVIGFIPVIPCEPEVIKIEKKAEQKPRAVSAKVDENTPKPAQSLEVAVTLVKDQLPAKETAPAPAPKVAPEPAAASPTPAPAPAPTASSPLEEKVVALLKEKGSITFPNIQKALDMTGTDKMKELYACMKGSKLFVFEKGAYRLAGATQ